MAGSTVQIVREQIAALGMFATSPEQIGLDSMLIEDLGLESLDLLDLMFGLEETMGVPIHLQDWIDQAAREGRPLTVASLAALCRQAVVTPFP